MTFFDDKGEVLPAIDHMRADYPRPVAVTFRVHGVKPAKGQVFHLWGDLFGDPDFTPFPMRVDAGTLEYRTTLMPGTFIHFQVYGDRAMQKPLLTGSKLTEGVVPETVGQTDTAFDFMLGKPVD
jgi:arabinogalactan endo-1,4-beta-galactosidase